MKPFIELHLQSDSDKAAPMNLPSQEREETRPVIQTKRLHKMVNRAAHKAASEFGRKGSGIFSK